MSSSGAHPFFVAGSRLKYFSGAVCNIKRCCEKEQTVQRKNTNGGASIHKWCSEKTQTVVHQFINGAAKCFQNLSNVTRRTDLQTFFCKKHESRVIFRDFPCI